MPRRKGKNQRNKDKGDQNEKSEGDTTPVDNEEEWDAERDSNNKDSLLDEEHKSPSGNGVKIAVDTKKPRLRRKGSKFDLQEETSSPLLRPEFVYENKQEG